MNLGFQRYSLSRCFPEKLTYKRWLINIAGIDLIKHTLEVMSLEIYYFVSFLFTMARSIRLLS
jgi:hypothetical protein